MKRTFTLLAALAMTLTMAAQTQMQRHFNDASKLTDKEKQQAIQREAVSKQHMMKATADYNKKRMEADKRSAETRMQIQKKHDEAKGTARNFMAEKEKLMRDFNKKTTDQNRPEEKKPMESEMLKKVEKLNKAQMKSHKARAKAQAEPVPYVEKLDSIVTVGVDKNVFKYDEFGNRYFEQYIQLQENGEWVVINEYHYAYNDLNLITCVDIYWRNLENELIVGRKFEYEYDAKGNTIVETDYELVDGELTARQRYEMEYDENNNRKTMLISTYDYDAKTLVYREKYEFDYDELGHQTLNIYYNYNKETGEFVISNKYEFAYDERDNRIYYAYYSVYEGGVYISYIENNAYDENNNQTLREYLYYRETGEAYYGEHYDYTFDAQGNRTSNLHKSWDLELAAWNKRSYYEWAYDSNNRLISQSELHDWDPETSTWDNGAKYEFPDTETTIISYWIYSNQAFKKFYKHVDTVDADGLQTHEEYGYNDNGNWDPMSKSQVKYDEEGRTVLGFDYFVRDNKFVPSGKHDYYYGKEGNLDVEISTHYYWGEWDNNWHPSYRTTFKHGDDYYYGNTENTKGDDEFYIGWYYLEETKPNGDYLEESMDYDWDRQQLYGSFKRVRNYDENGREILDEYYNGWDWTTNNWQGEYRREHEYDANGQTVHNADYNGMLNGVWIGNYAFERRFDENGYTIYYLDVNGWNYEHNTWNRGFKEEREYYGNEGLISHSKYSELENGVWYVKDTYTITYENGKQTAYESYRANDAHELVGDYKYIYKYNDEGQHIYTGYYNWSVEAHDWALTNDLDGIYADGLLAYENYYRYIDGERVLVQTTTYTYDEQKRLVSAVARQAGTNNVLYEDFITYEGYTTTTIRNTYDEEGTIASISKRIETNSPTWIHEEQSESYDGGQTWRGISSYIDVKYDEQGRILSSVYKYFWDTDLNDWTWGGRHTYTYDENDVQIDLYETLAVNWETNTVAWKADATYYNKFDENYRALVSGYRYWDEESQTWGYGRYSTYDYDEAGNTTEIFEYAWNIDKWELRVSQESTYDSNNRQTSYLNYGYTADGRKWGYENWRHEYDDHGYLTYEEEYRWMDDNQEWMLTRKQAYTYSEDGILLSRTYYNIDYGYVYSAFQVNYNEDGRIIFEANYDVNPETFDLTGTYAFSYIIDEEGNRIDEAYYIWDADTKEWVGDYYYLSKNEYDDDGYNLRFETAQWNRQTHQWDKLVYTYKYTFDENANADLIAGITGKKLLVYFVYLNGELYLTTNYYYSPFHEEDGIDNIISTVDTLNPMYDLQGHRTTALRPGHVYIHNGRKAVK